MKVVRSRDLQFIPASHEDPQAPGVLKKVLFQKLDLPAGRIQMINWASLKPGQAFRAHYHEDMAEVFVVLAGQATIRIDAEEAELAAGDAVLIPAHATHVMENKRDSACEYLALGISAEKGGQTIVV